MMFFIFIRACKKYKFTYALSSYGGLTLTLRPNNSFENIKVCQKYQYPTHFKLFLVAIKKMRAYRKSGGC